MTRRQFNPSSFLLCVCVCPDHNAFTTLSNNSIIDVRHKTKKCTHLRPDCPLDKQKKKRKIVCAYRSLHYELLLSNMTSQKSAVVPPTGAWNKKTKSVKFPDGSYKIGDVNWRYFSKVRPAGVGDAFWKKKFSRGSNPWKCSIVCSNLRLLSKFTNKIL